MDKQKIGIAIILIIIFVCIIIVFSKKGNDDISNNTINDNVESNIEIIYDEENGVYNLYNSETEEIIETYESEDDMQSQIDLYNDNPGYSATPPVSPNAE
jgi:uncharacterized membrane protein